VTDTIPRSNAEAGPGPLRTAPWRLACLILPAAILLSLAAAGCGRVDPVHAYFVPPQMAGPGPGRLSLCYNRVSESTESLQEMVRGVCQDARLLSNQVNLNTCSLFSPVEARFQCSHIVRSLAEERPPMPLEVLR